MDDTNYGDLFDNPTDVDESGEKTQDPFATYDPWLAAAAAGVSKGGPPIASSRGAVHGSSSAAAAPVGPAQVGYG